MYEEAIAEMQIRAPAQRNPRLAAFLEAVNADLQLKAWWYAQQANAERLQMSDHSWIHVQKVLNIALRLLRLLTKRGVDPVVVSDHGFAAKDAEVVVAAAALLHDTGMSIHRTDHEAYSLFLAARKLDSLLDRVYDEPARSI